MGSDQMRKGQGLIFASRFRTFFFFFLLLGALSPSIKVQAAAPLTDAQIHAVRELFGEKSHGIPTITVNEIDDSFALRLYKLPGALGALDRVLAGPGYADINEKLGQIREKAVLACWAEVVSETGVRIELNIAGKRNGGRSDLDIFVYTDDLELYDEEGKRVPPEKIHAYLIQKFQEKWSRHMTATIPEQWDVTVFSGDGMMMDWRMSKNSWRGFMAQMNADMARLSATDGAYFLPGAYKDQVFRRYLTEGETIIIESVADARGTQTFGLDLPDGVRISPRLPTREASRRYAGVPGEIDRNGALGVVLQNVIENDRHAASVIKGAKYNNRWIEGYVQLTDMTHSYKKLLLEGRDGARESFARNLFQAFDDKHCVPPNIESPQELMRVLDVMHRIELDKVLADISPDSRPQNWSEAWRRYQPGDISTTKTKLTYFAKEAQEMETAMRAASAQGYALDEHAQADHAENMFMDKARQAARMAAAAAAKRTMQDLFTRQGAARECALHGPEKAARQIVERLKGLHAALVFLNDEAMMRAIVAEAPAEARQAIADLAKIARAQRQDILTRKSSVDKLQRWQLEESDAVVARLLRDLSLDADELQRTPPPDPGGLSIRQRTHMEITNTMDRIGTHNRQRVYQFFDHELPRMQTAAGFSSQYWGNLCDIGTLNSLGQAAEAIIAGDTDRAMREFFFTVAEAVPVGGDIFSMGKGLHAYDAGQSAPTIVFLTNQMLKAVPGGAEYGSALGWVMAVYGLEQSLYNIGWHLYGQPAQDDLISLILMGSFNAIPQAGSQEQSAMPMIRNDEDRKLLQNNAILRKKVSIPNPLQESKALREAVLRAHLLPRTTRRAAAVSGGVQKREEIFQTEFMPYWEYWLRRILFYDAVFKEVVKTVSPDRIKMDASPPNFITPENKEEYRAAFRVKSDGTEMWNHEEAWLRYHFRERMLEPWIASQRQYGEIMNYLNDPVKRPFFMGSWEKAVVDELVACYREGEVFALARDADEADLRRKLRQAGTGENKTKLESALGFVRGAQEGSEAVINKVLLEQGQKSLDRQQTMEKAYWHKDVMDRYASSMTAAIQAQRLDGADQSHPTVIRLKIPRPVGRLGESIPMEVAVSGDVRRVPDADQLEVSVAYKKVSEAKGRLPEQVLRDDIVTLFGRQEDPQHLKVIEHELTVRVFSPKHPEFKVEPVRERVFWIAYDQTEEQAETVPETGPGMDAAALEGLRTIEADARRLADETAAHCEQTRRALDQLEQLISADEQALAQWQTARSQATPTAATQAAQLLQARRSQAEAIAVRMGEACVQIERLGLSLCQQLETLKASIQGSDPVPMARTIDQDFGRLSQMFLDTDTEMNAFDTLVREAEAAWAEVPRSAGDGVPPPSPRPPMTADRRKVELGRAGTSAGAASEGLGKLWDLVYAVKDRADPQSAGLGGTAPPSADLQALIQAVEAHLARVSECPGQVRERLERLRQRETALRQQAAQAQSSDVPPTPMAAQATGDAREARDLIQFLLELAESYRARMQTAVNSARICRDVSVQIAGSAQCESLQRRFNEALRTSDSQAARTIAAQAHGCTWTGSAAEEIRQAECRQLGRALDRACQDRDVPQVRGLMTRLGERQCRVDAQLWNRALALVKPSSSPSGSTPGQLQGNLDAEYKSRLLSKKASTPKLMRLSFESSEAKAGLNAHGAWQLTAPIQCIISFVYGEGYIQGLQSYTTTYTLNFTPLQGLRARLEVQRVTESVDKKHRREQKVHHSPAKEVSASLMKRGDGWVLQLPNGIAGLIGDVPYILQ